MSKSLTLCANDSDAQSPSFHFITNPITSIQKTSTILELLDSFSMLELYISSNTANGTKFNDFWARFVYHSMNHSIKRGVLFVLSKRVAFDGITLSISDMIYHVIDKYVNDKLEQEAYGRFFIV